MVVVTGVGGPVGQRVAARLAAAPDVKRVIGFDVVPTAVFPQPVETRVVDLAAPDAAVDMELAEALAGADGLINLAWLTGDARRRPDTAGANDRLTRRVVAAAALARPASVVHLSSATVYGAWPDNPIPLTEEATLRPNPAFGYAVEKADAERLLDELAASRPETAVAILRPAATVGSPERPLYRALTGTGVPRAADAARPVQFLHVDDLADAVVLAWRRRLRGPFNVAPDAGIPDEEARDLAGGLARVALPARMAGAVAGWGWQLARLGVPAAARPYALHPWAVAPDRLKAAGWEPRYSSAEALVATDDRPHWDDLPPGRRQNLTLGVVGAGVAAVGAAGVAGVLAARRRWGRG